MRSREEGGSVDRSGGVERQRLSEFGSGKSRSSHGGIRGTESLLFLFRPWLIAFVSLFFVDGLYMYVRSGLDLGGMQRRFLEGVLKMEGKLLVVRLREEKEMISIEKEIGKLGVRNKKRREIGTVGAGRRSREKWRG